MTTAPIIVIDINARCASKCGHCFFSKEDRDDDLVPLEDLLNAVRDAASVGCTYLVIAAREPFMGKRITARTLAVVGAAKAVGMHVTVIGSARFAPAGIRTLAEADISVDTIEVSLDAVGEAHDRYRGVSGDWAAADSLLRTDQMPHNVNEFNVSFTFHRHNTSEAVQLLDWLAAGPGDRPRVHGVLFATMSMTANNDPGLSLQPGQFAQIVADLDMWVAAHKDRFAIQLELTPNSVVDLCQLVESGILPMDENRVLASNAGLAVLDRGREKIPIRLLAGAFQYNRIIRIEADGGVRMFYSPVSQKQISLPHRRRIGNIVIDSLADIITRELAADHLLLSALKNAIALSSPEKKSCPAFPLHLNGRCIYDSDS